MSAPFTAEPTAPAPVVEAVVPRLVPNAWPAPNSFVGLAIIGEAPGADEEEQGTPFVGASGHRLNHMLGVVGIDRASCYVGNICQRRPTGNLIKNAPREWLNEGIATLIEDLLILQPKLVLCLGNTPLQWLSCDTSRKVGDWRGSLWQHPAHGWKCMATYHPAASLRQPEWVPVMRFDFRRVALELTSDAADAAAGAASVTMNLPVRNIRVAATVDEAIGWLHGVRAQGATFPHAFDIEGGIGNMTCISFANCPEVGHVIPFEHSGASVWTHDEEVRILEALKAWLEDPACPKILQNALYDAFVLAWSYGITIVNVQDDTMLKFWEQWCELEKGLGFQASILTREPFYKAERKSEDAHVADVYCGKDSCVTFEVNQRLSEILAKDPRRLAHYRFNVELLPAFLYMELTGFAFDKATAKARGKEVQREVWVLQHELNTIAGCAHPDLLAACVCAFVGKPTRKVTVERVSAKTGKPLKPATRCVPVEVTTWDLLVEHCLPSCADKVKEVGKLIQEAKDCATRDGIGATSMNEVHGRLSQVVGYGLNVDAPATLATYLYTTLGLPKHFKKEGNQNTDRLTTDNLALVSLYRQTEGKPTQRIIEVILRLRALTTQLDTLNAGTDPDGRVRCGYNSCGTDTGRVTCYESPTGSGFNLQTVSEKFRGLFSACPPAQENDYDDKHLAYDEWLAQCDLRGADSWTVAAHCAAAGDPTMLDDLLAGLSPAKVVAVMYEKGAAAMALSREELKPLCAAIDKKGWLAEACKGVAHGVAYGEGDQTISDSILKRSYKKSGVPIYVPTSRCHTLKQFFLRRYPGLERQQGRARMLLETTGQLTSASGHTRMFFGPRKEHSTFRQWLADEPQQNTTYACNLALHRLWHDPENRYANGPALCVRPVHVVHDALIVAFDVAGQGAMNKAWVKRKLHEWFDNVLTIAGKPIVIPFEGGMGPTWGELKEPV